MAYEERKRKAKIILALYKDREYRQEDVARELGIPITVVRGGLNLIDTNMGKNH